MIDLCIKLKLKAMVYLHPKTPLEANSETNGPVFYLNQS